MQFLYNSENVLDDVVNVLAFINDFTDSLGMERPEVNIYKVRTILETVRQDFPHEDGLDAASPFKKAAYFLCFFVAEAPILTEIPDAILKDPDLIKIHKVTNAIIGFEIAKEALVGATLKTQDGDKVIKNPISLSNHSYIDVISVLSKATPSAHFYMLSVLLEQMVYKTNPDCQYKCL